MHIVGDHDGSDPDDYNSIGMIYSYQNSRPLPVSGGEPVLPSSNDNDPLLRLMDFGQSDTLEEIAEHLDAFNDQTPNAANSSDPFSLKVNKLGNANVMSLGRR